MPNTINGKINCGEYIISLMCSTSTVARFLNEFPIIANTMLIGAVPINVATTNFLRLIPDIATVILYNQNGINTINRNAIRFNNESKFAFCFIANIVSPKWRCKSGANTQRIIVTFKKDAIV